MRKPAKYGSKEHHSRIAAGVRKHHAKRRKGWIKKLHLKKGALHKALGVPIGKPIPASKLAGALRSSNAHISHMAQFAKNAKRFKHKRAKRH
jgi:hypothetical protein